MREYFSAWAGTGAAVEQMLQGRWERFESSMREIGKRDERDSSRGEREDETVGDIGRDDS